MTARFLVVAFLLAARAAAADGRPVRVAVVCEELGRTKACPAFLLGLVDANKVLLSSPLAGADVVLYAATVEIGTIDRIHLRFVGAIGKAQTAIELDADLDTRATDDQQRSQLAPGFLQGISNFVYAHYPTAVQIALGAPPDLATAVPDTSPWGAQVSANASGNYTDKYRSASTDLSFVARYLTKRFRALTLEAASGGINKQPPLVLDDGTVASLDSTQWSLRGGAEAIYSFDDCWSAGVGSYTVFEDPKAQYDYSSRTRAAIEYDLFPADDPRGNRLGVFYHLGWAVDRYNLPNVLGERFAQYPLHGIDAVGSVRHDKMSYGLTLQSDVQLNHPTRRHSITASPFVSFQLGTHVDLELAFSITQRELPAPDPAAIDPSDFAQLSRLSYAEPLAMTGSLSLTIHWDPTNGVRNDRIDSI
jgi:hypothetical protein